MPAITITTFAPGSKAYGRPCHLLNGWREFHDRLANAPPGSRTQDKNRLPSWSPATFRRHYRDATSATSICALVLDWDNCERDKTPLPVERRTSPEQALGLWPSNQAILYTSWSHSLELDKFRHIIPYSRDVTPREHAVLWTWASEQITTRGMRVDPSCKDISRLWYMGNPGPHYRVMWQDGPALDVDGILELARLEAPEPPVGGVPTTTRFLHEPGGQEAMSRALRYVANKPGAVSGHGGHSATRAVATMLVWGFGLDDDQALECLRHYNHHCVPEWSERELRHKLNGIRDFCARSFDKPRGWALQQRRVIVQYPPSLPPPSRK